MSSNKKYVGNLYSFIRAKKAINKGGNGAVYDVTLVEPKEHSITYPVVAKFFEYTGNCRDKRYTRFKTETKKMSELKGISGVIEIIDMCCPEKVPQRKDAAWYLMPKAEEYKFNGSRTISQKLDDMISLAYTLQQLHKLNYVHRDIKTGNILILNKRIVLSDFGLIWCLDDERLTERDERIGPYKIMPPELEHIDPDLNLDFKPSDVYLFAKVLWMNLKNDNIGFRGRYNRGDDQIYLDKNKYNVCTLEPIHKLIEQATHEDMNQRITINECIGYLELQQKIFYSPESLPEKQIKQLQYEEELKRKVEKNNPNQYIYTEASVIYDILKSVIPTSSIVVESFGEVKKRIEANNCKMLDDKTFCFLFYVNGKKVYEYLANIKYMVYKIENETIELQLDDYKTENSDYKPYGKSENIIGTMFLKEYLSANQKILISKPGDTKH